MTSAQETLKALQDFKLAVKRGHGKVASNVLARLEERLLNDEKTKRPRGRPTLYSEEVANEICRRLANGESLISICRSEHLPERCTVHEWVIDGKHREFTDKYARAREAQGEAYGDECVQVAKEEPDPNKAKVIVQALQWSAARLRRKNWGDGVDVTSAGEKIGGVIAVPVPIASTTDWEAAAREAYESSDKPAT